MKQLFPGKTAILLLGLCSVFLTSCAARIDGSLAADGSASLTVNMSLLPRITSLIQTLTAASGQTGTLVLDGPAIARSMSVAPGITSVTLRNTSPSAVEGQVQISRISQFLAAAGNESIITFVQAHTGSRCRININLDNGPSMLENLSLEISDYLNALMAPIATGEQMSKAEYLELVASFYNKAISDEIAASRIRVSVSFPGQITSVQGGTFSGRRADFNIPLLDLLVLETPLIYEVVWN